MDIINGGDWNYGMDYRRNIVSNDEECSRQLKVFDSLNELVDETLCENQGNEFQSECLQRSCRHGGTKRFQFNTPGRKYSDRFICAQ